MQDMIKRDIDTLGFTTVAVADPKGSFAYTVGFTELGHPEIFLSGLTGETCHGLFWEIYVRIKAGECFTSGFVDSELANLPCTFRAMRQDGIEEFCCQALYYYEDSGKTPTFLQLVIPDRKGVMPWEDGYDAKGMKVQRRLWRELH